MATKKKMLQAAAGQAGGEALDITDVFSTYLYTGTGAAQTITNGIDLDGEGGLVWQKSRVQADDHRLSDTERGANNTLRTNNTGAQFNVAGSNSVSQFNSDGFVSGLSDPFFNGEPIASWTFRKAPKFFDVVTWDGDGVAGRAIPHNLGSVPGMIIVKCTSSAADWTVYHRGTAADPETDALFLNTTSAANDHPSYWNDTAPTDTVFSVGNGGEVNGNFSTYVAYVFAHNDGDGEFGPDSDQDIIKCGSYTGNGSTDGPEIDLGFEPQWIMFKRTTGVENWIMFDNMRGMVVGGIDPDLRPDLSQAEGAFVNYLEPNPTGFKLTNANSRTNENGDTYIYMAIRRGPLAQPESATEVFAIDNQTASSAPFLTSDFPVDMAIRKKTTGSNSEVMSRLTQGKALFANATSLEQTDSVAQFDFNDGCLDNTGTDAARYGWMWKRAPGYFDVVAYTGDNAASHAIDHNLGVVPEMMWCKGRDISKDWNVYHSGLGTSGGNQGYLGLNLTNAAAYTAERFAAAPTSTQFIVGNNSRINSDGSNYIAYLFASLPGISKVGSYTGNGGTQTIDCGFTSGARFVLIKNTEQGRGWVTIDTTRGLTSGDDKVLYLNATNAQSDLDFIDPNSSGFTLSTSNDQVNASGRNYIFYAIA